VQKIEIGEGGHAVCRCSHCARQLADERSIAGSTNPGYDLRAQAHRRPAAVRIWLRVDSAISVPSCTSKNTRPVERTRGAVPVVDACRRPPEGRSKDGGKAIRAVRAIGDNRANESAQLVQSKCSTPARRAVGVKARTDCRHEVYLEGGDIEARLSSLILMPTLMPPERHGRTSTRRISTALMQVTTTGRRGFTRGRSAGRFRVWAGCKRSGRRTADQEDQRWSRKWVQSPPGSAMPQSGRQRQLLYDGSTITLSELQRLGVPSDLSPAAGACGEVRVFATTRPHAAPTSLRLIHFAHRAPALSAGAPVT